MRKYGVALGLLMALMAWLIWPKRPKPEPPKQLAAKVDTGSAISFPVLNQNTVGTITANDVLTALDASNAEPGDVPCVKNGVLAFRRPGECGAAKPKKHWAKPATEAVTDSAEGTAIHYQLKLPAPPDGKVCVTWVNNWETCTAWADKSFLTTVPVGGDSSEMDVPSVVETRQEEYGSDDWCNTSTGNGAMGGVTSMYCDPHAKHKVEIETCEDKTRILAHSEDGKGHCLKFKFGEN